jgi:ribosome-associated protein
MTEPNSPLADEEIPSIHLEQFLKISGVVGTGGQAKQIIQGGEVLVNGHTETRRKRKLFPGDQVEAMGELLEVQSD